MTDLQQVDSSQSGMDPKRDYAQQIVNAVSHDLKNPTRQIKSFLQILQSHSADALDEKGAHYMDLVLQAADTLQVKLDALTLLSRASTSELQIQPCDASTIIDEVIARLEPQLGASGAEVNADVSAKVNADPKHLSAVFLELIGNSLKFCDDPAKIHITAKPADHECVFSVVDSGPGFEARDYSTAFDLFRRFHLDDYEGTGTGLTVVRTLLDRHGSAPTISSGADGGTTVTFSLLLA